MQAIDELRELARGIHPTMLTDRGLADGKVLIEVADDGVGGASTYAGSGLRGLVDRVEALDGTLFVSSPAGSGTTIRGEIPCA